MNYEVTLTQKMKKQIEAESPEKALQEFTSSVKKAKTEFAPTGWVVKEKPIDNE